MRSNFQEFEFSRSVIWIQNTYFFFNCFCTDITNTELCTVYICLVFGFQGLIIFFQKESGKEGSGEDKMAVWETRQGVLFAQTSKLIVLDNSAA